ncbi:MAG TPA: hypothetical protein ACFYD3_03330 [Candidatus Hypogeohydataceae bacterium YC41]
MPVKGSTDATTTLNLKTAVNVQPTELKLHPNGKITIGLPGLRVKLPDIRMKVLGIPFIRIFGVEVNTEPMRLEVNLSETVMMGRIEKPTFVELLTSGEVKASANLEGGGTFTGGPITLQA